MKFDQQTLNRAGIVALIYVVLSIALSVPWALFMDAGNYHGGPTIDLPEWVQVLPWLIGCVAGLVIVLVGCMRRSFWTVVAGVLAIVIQVSMALLYVFLPFLVMHGGD